MHATLYGGVTYSPTNGGQLVFNGIDGYGDLPDGFANFTKGLTVIAAVDFRDGYSFERIFDLGNGRSDANIWFGRTAANDLTVELLAYSQNWSNCSSCIEPGTQRVYVLRLNGVNADFFVDGTLVASNAYPSIALNVTRTSNFIGKSNWPDPFFAGSMQVLKIYDRPLMLGQILNETQLIRANAVATRTPSPIKSATRTSTRIVGPTHTATKTLIPTRSRTATKSSTATRSPSLTRSPTVPATASQTRIRTSTRIATHTKLPTLTRTRTVTRSR